MKQIDLVRKVIKPTRDEILKNRRARSTKLRFSVLNNKGEDNVNRTK